MTGAARAAALGGVLLAAAAGPRYGQVILPGGAVLHVEVADTPERQARGYMFRDRPGPEDGMIFAFAADGVHNFWMKNVRFPLDMVWISSAGEVLHVEPRVPPCEVDPCPSFGPMVQVRYVLELAGGQAAVLGLGVGDRLQILLTAAAGDGGD
jgi:hypothetical protein